MSRHPIFTERGVLAENGYTPTWMFYSGDFLATKYDEAIEQIEAAHPGHDIAWLAPTTTCKQYLAYVQVKLDLSEGLTDDTLFALWVRSKQSWLKYGRMIEEHAKSRE